MRTEHPELWPVLRSLRSYWTDHLDWPTRSTLFDRVKHKYSSLTEVETVLDQIDGAFNLRWELNCGDHLDYQREACGTPIYRFNIRNPHGPAGVRYGLTPFRGTDVVDRHFNRSKVLRGVLNPVEMTDDEWRSWSRHLAARHPLELGVWCQPDRLLWETNPNLPASVRWT